MYKGRRDDYTSAELLQDTKYKAELIRENLLKEDGAKYTWYRVSSLAVKESERIRTDSTGC